MYPRAEHTHRSALWTARAANPTTRRGMPWQEGSPNELWPTVTAVMAALSQGHHPAHPRHAISTREHQKGGAPTRSASTRRGHPPRPPPRGPGQLESLPAPLLDHPLPGTRVKGATRRYAISLRLTRDPPHPCAVQAAIEAGRRLARAPKPPPTDRQTRHTTAMPVLTLDRAVPHQFVGGHDPNLSRSSAGGWSLRWTRDVPISPA
jgi:hypothetical protein